jgi:TetR/AcrR family fatty acid metabolism transcriptional regulator
VTRNPQTTPDASANGKAARGVPKDAAESDKHDRIIAAAIKVFAENGFHNSKISQIAKEAGVADGTIYLYFKNKDDILISLFEEKMGEIVERLEAQIAAEPDPVAKLRRFIESHIEMMNEHQDLGEVLTVELRQSHKFMKEYTPARFRDYLNVLSRILREGKDKGVFASDVDPGIAKRAIYGAIDELFVNWMLSPRRKYDLKAAAHQITGIFLEGMLRRS